MAFIPVEERPAKSGRKFWCVACNEMLYQNNPHCTKCHDHHDSTIKCEELHEIRNAEKVWDPNP